MARELTRIPQTIDISNAVGTMRKIMACRRNVMPLNNSTVESLRNEKREAKTNLVPRSIALVNPPVCRDK